MAESHVKLTLKYILERADLSRNIHIDGNNLSIPEVLAISQDPGLLVSIEKSAIEQMGRNAAYLKKKLENGLVVYGINTGFGGSAEVRSWKLEAVQKALIRHVNAGMGSTFPAHLVRAAMVTRCNCLCKAYSGVKPEVPYLLADLINNDIVPKVPLRGSVSASGDLMPLSYIAAAMVGREDLRVVVQGIEMPCTDALKQAKLEPIVLGPKEGLAIINADSFAAGVAAPTLYDANIALLLTQVSTGLAVESLRGRTESFHPVIHRCLPHTGQKEIAENMLGILQDSKLAITTLDMHLPDKYGVLKQDRYSLRSSPQWLGPVAETLKDACRRITIELNSANDNPVIDHRSDTIAHGANFQGETLSIAMDQTRQVLGICGKLLFAQFSEVVNNRLNFGLPPNLSGCDINLDFGFKGADTAMASYMSELDHVVNPMSNHVVSAEMHNQSVNSMALVSARLTRDALEIVQMMLANLLCLLSQAVDLRHLRNLVLEELDSLTSPYPAAQTAVANIEWYDFVFFPQEKAKELAQHVTSSDLETFEETIETRMTMLYDSICSGEAGTAKKLGKGTRKMYNFIRNELDIPFYCGQAPVDSWLNKLLEAIQERSIEHVLLEIFTTDANTANGDYKVYE